MQACAIRRKAREAGQQIPTDEEILNHFIKEGKIKADPLYEKQKEPLEMPKPKMELPKTRKLTKLSSHNGSPESNDDQPQSLLMNKEIVDLMKDAILSGKDIPSNVLYLLAVQSFMQNPTPQWFAAIQSFMKDKEKITANESKQTQVIAYQRSLVWSPKQAEIMDKIQISHCAIEGDKQTGKTTCTYGAIIENCIMNETHWHFFAQNGNNAQRLYIKARDDKPNEQFKSYYAAYSSTKCTIKNIHNSISIFEIHNTTINDVSGCTGNIWIDEVDKVLKDNPQVIGTAVALLRSKPQYKLIFSMNKGSGVYGLLVEKLQKWKFESGKSINVEFLLLERKDAPWAQNQVMTELGERDEFIGDVMEVCMGEDFVKQQLENQDTGSGDAFNFTSLEDAFVLYETYLNHLHNKYPPLRFMTIDPSGTGHPFGVFIGGYNPLNHEHIEIESREIQMGDVDPVTHEQWSPQKINTWLLAKCREYNIKKVAIESNSGGQQIAIFLRANGIDCVMQNFGAPNAPNSRSAFIKLANHFLDERKVVLKNPKLKSELTIYNPTKDKEKFKGDVADAFLHYLWLAVGGIGFLRTQAREQALQGKQDEMFGVI